jgi:hypothetical protein
MENAEFSATEIRKILQGLFPHRRLVLSQFTFFNQVGVATPTGSTYKRGRRCYRLRDLLSIACILALKEEGIPYKNVEDVPRMIQEDAERIFAAGEGCRLYGVGGKVGLCFPGSQNNPEPLDAMLDCETGLGLFWGFDVGLLATQLSEAAQRVFPSDVQHVAA